MATIRPFRCNDFFKIANINLDMWTETYNMEYYIDYLTRWPEYFEVVEAPNGELMGYCMGKVEGSAVIPWHGHVSAVTVAPAYRGGGAASELMHRLEYISESHKAYFVDLFVRASNVAAVEMYRKLGYVVYRTVLKYYSGQFEEDALDMRKALARDRDKKSVVPITTPVPPSVIYAEARSVLADME